MPRHDRDPPFSRRRPLTSPPGGAGAARAARGEGGGDDDVRAAVDAIRRVVRALRLSAREAEAKAGVSGAQLFVLRRLADEGRLSLGELAARTLTDPSSVSTVVAKLAAAGLVARARSVDDGRRAEVSITARGRAALGRAPDAAQDRLIAALGRLPAAERRRLARSLGAVVAAMGEGAGGPAPMFFEEAAGEGGEAGPPRGARSEARGARAATRPPRPARRAGPW